MHKRIVATGLWCLAGMYGTAMLTELTGLSSAIAPFVGAAVGAFVAMDPLGLLWPRVAAVRTASQADATIRTDPI